MCQCQDLDLQPTQPDIMTPTIWLEIRQPSPPLVVGPQEPFDGLVPQKYQEPGLRLAKLIKDGLSPGIIRQLGWHRWYGGQGKAMLHGRRQVRPIDGSLLLRIDAAVRHQVAQPRIITLKAQRLEEEVIESLA